MRIQRDLVPVPFGVEMWSLYAMLLFRAPAPRPAAKRSRATSR